MAYCAKCGAQITEGASFCPGCGTARGSQAERKPATTGGGSAAAGASGLDENIAGLLSYVAGWITGLVFFLIDQRPFVRFHAAQSMVVFGALFVVGIALNFIFPIIGMAGWAIRGLLSSIIGLVSLAAWILCMVKAYQGERFKLPFLGDIAENIAGK
jgi:uncharacterized membrane protein